MNWNYKKQKYFLFDPEGDGMQYFDTARERDAAAHEALQRYLEDSIWSEETSNLVIGIVTHSAQRCDVQERPADDEIDEDGCGPDGTYWDPDWEYICNYEIRPIDGD